MPNHIHAIIVIQNIKTDTIGCDCIAPGTNIESGTNNVSGTNIVSGMNTVTGTNIAPGKNIVSGMNIAPKTEQPENGTMQSFPTLSRVIRGMKGRITSRIQKECEDGYAFAWQKSFYDVIIRNEKQLHKTRQYICDNPKNWNTDSNNI